MKRSVACFILGLVCLALLITLIVVGKGEFKQDGLYLVALIGSLLAALMAEFFTGTIVLELEDKQEQEQKPAGGGSAASQRPVTDNPQNNQNQQTDRSKRRFAASDACLLFVLTFSGSLIFLSGPGSPFLAHEILPVQAMVLTEKETDLPRPDPGLGGRVAGLIYGGQVRATISDIDPNELAKAINSRLGKDQPTAPPPDYTKEFLAVTTDLDKISLTLTGAVDSANTTNSKFESHLKDLTGEIDVLGNSALGYENAHRTFENGLEDNRKTALNTESSLIHLELTKIDADLKAHPEVKPDPKDDALYLLNLRHDRPVVPPDYERAELLARKAALDVREKEITDELARIPEHLVLLGFPPYVKENLVRPPISSTLAGSGVTTPAKGAAASPAKGPGKSQKDHEGHKGQNAPKGADYTSHKATNGAKRTRKLQLDFGDLIHQFKLILQKEQKAKPSSPPDSKQGSDSPVAKELAAHQYFGIQVSIDRKWQDSIDWSRPVELRIDTDKLAKGIQGKQVNWNPHNDDLDSASITLVGTPVNIFEARQATTGDAKNDRISICLYVPVSDQALEKLNKLMHGELDPPQTPSKKVLYPDLGRQLVCSPVTGYCLRKATHLRLAIIK